MLLNMSPINGLSLRKLKDMVKAIPSASSLYAVPSEEEGVFLIQFPADIQATQAHLLTLKAFNAGPTRDQFKRMPLAQLLPCFVQGFLAAGFPMSIEDAQVLGKHGLIALISSFKKVEADLIVNLIIVSIDDEQWPASPNAMSPAGTQGIAEGPPDQNFQALQANLQSLYQIVRAQSEETSDLRKIIVAKHSARAPGEDSEPSLLVKSLNDQQQETSLPYHSSHRQQYVVPSITLERRKLFCEYRTMKSTKVSEKAAKEFPSATTMAGILELVFKEAEALASVCETTDKELRLARFKTFNDDLAHKWQLLSMDYRPKALEAERLEQLINSIRSRITMHPALPGETPDVYFDITMVAELSLFVHREYPRSTTYLHLRRLMIARHAPAVFSEEDELAWFNESKALPKQSFMFPAGL